MSRFAVIIVPCATALACHATELTPRAPSSAGAPSSPAAASAPSDPSAAATPAAPPDTGEHPTVACAASHPVAALPLSAVNVDDWAAAIAGYKPQANGGRPTSWLGAEGQVNAYLDAVHACVHQAFADSFLRSLRELPKGHALSDPELEATVELVVDGESGKLAEIGIVGSSGVPEFDAAGVAAFGRAFPLAPPPATSLSSDGRFYVTWELHRRPEEACRREQARPWKLRF